MAWSVELSFSNLIFFAFIAYVAKRGHVLYKVLKTQKLLSKWNNTPKGKVILHAVPRGKLVPSISPFCLKLETYLRMAGVPYEFSAEDPFGPKGKSPWISLNGFHLADTHLIIEFLNKKFGTNFSSHLTPEQREITRTLRIMVENHFFWGLASWRWIEDSSTLGQLMNFSPLLTAFMKLRSKRIAGILHAQGLGRYTFQERNDMVVEDLRSVSIVLGKKAFIGGEKPCEDDCAIFGLAAQVVWAAPNSPFEKLVEGELQNLKLYCVRMRDRFWPDWNECLD